MAKIAEYIKDKNKRVSSNVSETICIYNSDIINGEKLCVFNTIGSKNREIKGKSSQTLHFDKESAEKMIDILQEEFNL